MSISAEQEDRQGRVVAELASLGLELARDLQRRALEAKDNAEAARLAEAFHKVSRGVRQTLALDLRLIRFRAELARENPERRRQATQAVAAAERRQDVRDAVERVVWNEYEAPEAEAWLARLEAWLDGQGDAQVAGGAHDALLVEACEAIGLDLGHFFEVEDEPPGAAPAPDLARGPAPEAADTG